MHSNRSVLWGAEASAHGKYFPRQFDKLAFGVPKIWNPFLGGPIIRNIIYVYTYWSILGPAIYENYHQPVTHSTLPASVALANDLANALPRQSI